MALKARPDRQGKSAGRAARRSGGPAGPHAQRLRSAALAHQAGRLNEAERAYEAVLAAQPDNVDALQLMGVLRHQLGDNEAAGRLLERAVTLDPKNAYARNNYGGILKTMSRFEAADAQFAEALRLIPHYVDALVNRGATLTELERFDEAYRTLIKARKLDRDRIDVRRRLGHLYLKMEKFPEAEAEFRAFLDRHPADAEELSNLAYTVYLQGRTGDAAAFLRKALDLAGDNVILQENLRDLMGVDLRTEEERAKFRDALRANPMLWPVKIAIACNLLMRGNAAAGQQLLDDILAAYPDHANVWNDVGSMLFGLGKNQQAIEVLQKAIEFDTRLAAAQTNLGNVFLSSGYLNAAIQCYRQALAQNPGFVQAQAILTRALRMTEQYDQAHLFGRGALDMPNRGAEEMPALLQLFRALCDFDALDQLGDVWENCNRLKLEDLTGIFLDLLVTTRTREDVAKLVALVRQWASKMEGLAAQAPLTTERQASADGRIRVGILSADLRSHSVACFLMPLIDGYDRSKIMLHCYSPSHHIGDTGQARIRDSVDRFTFIDNLTLREIAEKIRADGIDVLLELNGFTQGSRLGALAYKPAPVQICWLGYPFTCGLKAIDYVMLDRYVLPVDESTLVEQPLIMPDAWACFGKFEEVAIDPTLPMDRNGVVTFGTLNNPYKYNREMIARWAQAMAQVPNSRLLIVRPEASSVAFCHHMVQEFGKHGISADRLFLFNNRTEQRSHLSYYNEIDISLDTFPLTGGTTTCEALWMGVPVVSLVGEAYHQRISYSALMHCGLEELCTFAPDDFVTRAAALAGERDKLAWWRTNLREIMRASPVCDEPRFLYQFQEMLEQVAQAHRLR